ncbi:thermosome subunit alpha [Halomicroarcula sp. GCM10025817]|uniref:thermosome subunit alpha n=1 Tax=Haloarcula TaxID=2237 RepID=UPI0023E89C30|nr:thermosome subunit alpha [Halomicroarcula sp. SYNS111]
MNGSIREGITGPEDSISEFGPDERSVRQANIAAGRAVGDLVRTTMGPRGMDKLLVDRSGMGIVTNNGASILRETVEHPVGDLIADVAVSQEDEVNDGTTTAATVAAELLAEAEALMDQDVHPTTIVNGYLAAVEHAVEKLEDDAVEIDPSDTERLIQIARTAMSGKSVKADANIPELVVEAAQQVATDDGIDVDDVRTEKITGAQVVDSFLADSIQIGKERADASSPYRVEDADIAVLNKPVEARELSGDAEVNLLSTDEFDGFREGERSEAIAIAQHLDDLGVDAVIGGEDIQQVTRSYLAKQGIYVVRRADDEDVRAVAKATGAEIVTDPRDMTVEDLGHADVVEEVDVGGERKTSIKGPQTREIATLVLYGSTTDVVDEVERAVEDALSAVALALNEPKILPGGGATETAAALELRQWATQHETREQLAIQAFAHALEVVPRTLAENAGINPVDGVVDVRAAQSTGTPTAGIDGETGEVVDALAAGIVEPPAVKRHSIRAATDAAVAILRIDDALPKREETPDEMPGGEMDGPGGMPGGGMGGL